MRNGLITLDYYTLLDVIGWLHAVNREIGLISQR